MSDYYDYHARVHLQRHLVLAGYFSDDTRNVGFQLAALTGLGVNDLEQTVEHFAGQSIAKLIANEGEPRYRQLEAQQLQRLLASQPHGIITLGDGTLIDEINRGCVLEGADLVVLDVDLPTCFWQIKNSPAGARAAWHPLYPWPADGFEQVRPFYERRQPGFAQASHRIDMIRHQRSEAVDELMQFIGSPPFEAP